MIQEGLYYRLTNPLTEKVGAWEFISEDLSRVLVNAVVLQIHGNMPVNYVRLKGLKENCIYREQKSGRTYASNALMECGILIPNEMGDYQAYQMYFELVNEVNNG